MQMDSANGFSVNQEPLLDDSGGDLSFPVQKLLDGLSTVPLLVCTKTPRSGAQLTVGVGWIGEIYGVIGSVGVWLHADPPV